MEVQERHGRLDGDLLRGCSREGFEEIRVRLRDILDAGELDFEEVRMKSVGLPHCGM